MCSSIVIARWLVVGGKEGEVQVNARIYGQSFSSSERRRRRRRLS